MKLRKPRFGCVRIAQQISHAFGIEIDKDVVHRVLALGGTTLPGNPERHRRRLLRSIHTHGSSIARVCSDSGRS